MKILWLCFLLLACATPTPYQSADFFGKGYRDQKLDKDKARVSFKGNKVTERHTVESYLIYRAAEVTQKEGFKYFTMMNMNTDRKTEYESVSPIVYGFYANDQRRFPYYVYGFPGQARGGTMSSDEYEAVAFINMVQERPEAKKEIYYEAAEVIKSIGPKIVREKQ